MTDPYRCLGVASDADDATIRAAYLAALATCPPERDRQRFEQVRAAYEAIADATRRQAHALFNVMPPTPRALLETLSAEWQPGRPGEASLRRVIGGA